MALLPEAAGALSRGELPTGVREAASAFAQITEVPVLFYDTAGTVLWRSGSDPRVCDSAASYRDPESPCRRTLLSSIHYAATLGEAYVFLCQGGLVHVAVSLLSGGRSHGAIIAGPILMGDLKESTVQKMVSVGPFSPEEYPSLLLHLKSMRARTPREVSSLALLLYNSIVCALGSFDAYQAVRTVHQKQAQLGSTLQGLKRSHTPTDYPHALEQRMLQAVKQGDPTAAGETARQLIHAVCAFEAYDLDAVRARLFGLYAVVLRDAAVEVDPTDFENSDVTALYDEQDPEGLGERFARLVAALAGQAEGVPYRGTSEIVGNAVAYLQSHYTEKITLRDAAASFHVNPSYLSMLFKQEMGIGFSEYLSRLRVREARRLLAETRLSMVDIAARCGFDDQSYFTKVFRKWESITPKEYRGRRP